MWEQRPLVATQCKEVKFITQQYSYYTAVYIWSHSHKISVFNRWEVWKRVGPEVYKATPHLLANRGSVHLGVDLQVFLFWTGELRPGQGHLALSHVGITVNIQTNKLIDALLKRYTYMYFIYMKAHFDSHKYVHLALIIDLKCGIVFTFSLLTYVLS